MIRLTGEWLIAVPVDVWKDPESIRGSGKDPAKAVAPPDPAVDPHSWRTEYRSIPGCWEQWGWSKRIEGPVWFITDFRWDGNTEAVLTFEAVSYFCHVWVNRAHVGCHRGMWDRFDICCRLEAGLNQVAVEVFKPWERWFPTKTTLAGFIPYVTSTFGGIWGPVTVGARPAIEIADLYAYGFPGEDTVHVHAHVHTDTDNGSGMVLIRIAEYRFEHEIDFGDAANGIDFTVPVRDLAVWQPSDPVMHELTLSVAIGVEHTSCTTRFGIRRFDTRERAFRLNGTPFYPRGILHWMAYVNTIAPIWNPASHRREMEHLKSMGFNMIKMCLVVPPEEYLAMADEAGMLIWIELPMWMPSISGDYREQARKEYRRIVKQLRGHPSVVMWTLGCELDSEADADFLSDLFQTVKTLTPGSPVLRDNSGSGEAYGGVDLDQSDFYDYHFYAEADRFSDLVDHFMPGWKTEKPLIFGEYCDSDTLRNVADWGNPWWASVDDDANPRGVRWDMSITTHALHVESLPSPFSWQEAQAASRRKSMEYRRLIMEATRSDPRIGGYIITNIMDTPISTAGVLDIDGEPKFDHDEIAALNGGLFLSLYRDTRRSWTNGGDRPRPLDPYNISQGKPVQFRIVASNYVSATDPLTMNVCAFIDDTRVLADQSYSIDTHCGETGLVATVGMTPPLRDTPYELELEAVVSGAASADITTTWPVWCFPPVPEIEELPCTWDPYTASRFVETDHSPAEDGDMLITSRLDAKVLEHFGKGHSALVIIDFHTPPLTHRRPFWREGVPLIRQKSTFEDLPGTGASGRNYLAITPDLALDIGAVNRAVGSEAEIPALRIDARTLEKTAYWMEFRTASGAQLHVTTFRLAGREDGLPRGFEDNPLGAYLLNKAIYS